MRNLHNKELNAISGGCSEEDLSSCCQLSVLVFLELCDMSQLRQVNSLFKAVVLDENFKNADEATIKAAMIEAIENATF